MLSVLKKQEVLWQKAGISASRKMSLVQKSYLAILLSQRDKPKQSKDYAS